MLCRRPCRSRCNPDPSRLRPEMPNPTHKAKAQIHPRPNGNVRRNWPNSAMRRFARIPHARWRPNAGRTCRAGRVCPGCCPNCNRPGLRATNAGSWNCRSRFLRWPFVDRMPGGIDTIIFAHPCRALVGRRWAIQRRNVAMRVGRKIRSRKPTGSCRHRPFVRPRGRRLKWNFQPLPYS